MTWNYVYTPHIWPSLLSVLLLLAFAIYAARHRDIPGILPFIIACLFGAVWAAGSVMEFAATTLATKIFWVKFEAIWQLPAATTITCFVLEYAWPGRWLTRRNLALLSIAPLLVLGMILTDHQYHLIWRSFSLEESVFPQLGLGGWIAVIYSYGLVFLSIGMFAWLFLQSPLYRWPVTMMVTGHVGFRLLFILQKANLIYSDQPLDLIGLAFMAVMYAIALFGFRMFDPIPLARQTAIEQLRDGMLVLDPRGRVASLNPAAEHILGASLKLIRGKPIGDLLPGVPELSRPLSGEVAPSKPIEVKAGSVAGTRFYELDFSPLKDFRGLPIGSLLLLHDVTEQQRNQAQLLEHQRALATVNERERLARELHDELSQDLTLINLQAQLVSGLLETGQVEQAQAQLQILAKAARGAQVDVRGEISKLSHSISPQKGFLGALKQYLETFQQTYGIETELVLPGADQVIPFAPSVEVQLLRIVQEAFTNIRKHARAKHAGVVLMREPGCLKLMIEDDGIGFDPESLSSSRQTFGLGIMSNRAEEINSWLEVQSAPGQGTRVTVMVPVNSEVNRERLPVSDER